MSTATLPPVETEARLRRLRETIVLVAPSCSYWRGTYHLPKQRVAVSVGNETINTKNVTVPQALLLDDAWPRDRDRSPWKKRLQGLSSDFEAVSSRFSVPFPINGIRAIPLEAASQYMAEADECAARMDAAATEFVADLDRILDEIRENIDPVVWRAVEAKIPRNPVAMRGKFCITTVFMALPSSDDPAHRVTMRHLQQHERTIRGSLDRVVDEAITELVSRPREALAQAMTNLRELISKQGRVTAKSFRPVEAAIEKLNLFKFAATPDLLRQIEDFARTMRSTSPNELTAASAATSGFVAALDAVVDEIEDATKEADAVAAFGRRSRGLILDD